MNSCKLNDDTMYLGYYPIRGKCQVCRLLCEYLGLQYTNIFFTPYCWKKFQSTQAKNWLFADLPFVKDGDFVATETYPISLYIIRKANRNDLLGANLHDRIKVQSFIGQNDILSLVLNKLIELKDQSCEVQMETMNKLYENVLKEKFERINKECCENFYLGYLTIIDFYIYEIMHFFKSFDCKNQQSYTKIVKVFMTVGEIPEIKNYETSKKAVKKFCPLKFCEEWKEKCCPSKTKKQQTHK